MAFKDVITFDETAPILPDPTNNAVVPESSSPPDVEDMFNPSPAPLPRSKPMRVEVAEAAPPMPTRSDAVRNSGQTTEPAPTATIVPQDDSRYQDPSNIIIGDVILGGTLPWLQAASDLAAGRITGEQFDAARMEHQTRIRALRDQHPEFVSAAEKAVPFLTGLGIGIMKPASTVAGTVARGAAATVPQGAAKGFTSGPVEEPSLSAERGAGAVGGAATNMAIGAAGAAAPAIASQAKGLIGKTVSIIANRRAAKAEEAAAKRLDEQAAAASASDRRAQRMGESMKLRMKQQEAENESIIADYQRYTRMPPEGTSKYWDENRKAFIADPVNTFYLAAERGMGIDGLAKTLNLPPSVVVARLAGKDIHIKTPGDEQLFKSMEDVNRVMKEFKSRGLKAPTTTPEKPPAATQDNVMPDVPKKSPPIKARQTSSALKKKATNDNAPAEPKAPKTSKATEPGKPRALLPQGSLGRWIQDNFQEGKTPGQLHDAYVEWAKSNKSSPMNQKDFERVVRNVRLGTTDPKPPRGKGPKR